MKWKIGMAVVALASLWGFVCLRLIPERQNIYQGLTAAQWEWETSRWWLLGVIDLGRHGRHPNWVRRTSRGEALLQHLGFLLAKIDDEMVLLKGDPAALPVLVELLESRKPTARLMAVDGLGRLGEQARSAVPALLPLLDDPDESVRWQAWQALYHIDCEAAARAGLEWTKAGLIRRPK